MTIANQPGERSSEKSLQTEAASWFVRIHTREPSTEEIAGWQRWLIADPAHAEAFRRFEVLWGTIGQTEAHLVKQAADDPTANAPTPPIRESGKRWHYALAAGIAIAAVGMTFLALRSGSSAPLPPSAVVETQIAEDRSYALSDGSRVDVGARTTLIVDFSNATRTVIIDEGEAYFDVAHETRPFIVRAGSGTITAVGTAFNVRNVSGRVAVTVVEGAVDVQSTPTHANAMSLQPTPAVAAPAPQIVRAGEGVVYHREFEAIEPVDAHLAIAWREGKLMYIREPLGYVVADVERYSDFRITIADPAVAKFEYTGTVLATDIDDLVELLPQVFPIEVQRLGKRAVLLKLRTDTTPN